MLWMLFVCFSPNVNIHGHVVSCMLQNESWAPPGVRWGQTIARHAFLNGSMECTASPLQLKLLILQIMWKRKGVGLLTDDVTKLLGPIYSNRLIVFPIKVFPSGKWHLDEMSFKWNIPGSPNIANYISFPPQLPVPRDEQPNKSRKWIGMQIARLTSMEHQRLNCPSPEWRLESCSLNTGHAF